MEKIHVRTSLTTFVAGELIRIIGFLDIICIHKKNYIYIFLGQVEWNIDLVYGGGSIGLMGLVSQAVFDGGRHVLG